LLGAFRSTGVAACGLLEVFDDVAKALETVGGRVQCANFAAPGRNNEEGRALEEQDLFCHNELAQIAEMLLNLVEIGDKVVDDFSPCLVKGLVPDGSCKRDGNEVIRLFSDDSNSLVVDIFALRWDNQIHLVDEYVDA